MSREIIGHDQQRAALARLQRAGRLPATMLLAGPAGIGKSLIAGEVAASLLCEQQDAWGGCGRCRPCLLIEHRNHPDLFLVDCADSERWALEGIRELLYSLHLRAFAGANRVVIFDHAEDMSIQAANVLLKHLEEPRPNTWFILVSANQSRLPRTLLSRCQVWFFDRLTDAGILAALRAHPELTGGADPSELAMLADGSLRQAQVLSEDLDAWATVRERLDGVMQGDLSGGFGWAVELGRKKDRLDRVLLLMRIHARTRMLSEADPARQARWANLVTNILTAERLIFERNLTPVGVLQLLMLHLAPGEALGSFTTLTNSDTFLDAALTL